MYASGLVNVRKSGTSYAAPRIAPAARAILNCCMVCLVYTR